MVVDGDRADVVGVDAVAGGQQAFVGVSGQGDAFELRVGQQAVEGEERRQEGAVLGDGWGDVGHRGGLDQRRRVLDGAGNPEGDRSPLRPGGVAAAHLLRVAVDFLDVEAAGARIEGEARRQRGDQAHQLLEVVDDGERVDVRIALGGCAGGTFEDQEARFDAGAAALVDGARDAAGEQDAGRRGAAAEGVAPGGGVGDAAGADDGDEAAVGSECRVGRLDVGQVDVAAPLADRGPGGERRVHEDDVGAHVRQPVADLFGVVPGDAGVVVDHGEQRAADVGQFVEVQLRGAVEDGAGQGRRRARAASRTGRTRPGARCGGCGWARGSRCAGSSAAGPRHRRRS